METAGTTLGSALPAVGIGMAGYLLGSVNFSLLAARALGLGDLRKLGSGNAGATNLARAAGKFPAAIVLALDVGRGAAIVLVAAALGFFALAPFAALPLILGNVFPIFHGFRGGKGVAAAVGASLAVSPLAMLAGGLAFLSVFALWRRVSAGSLAMVATTPAAMALFGGNSLEALAFAFIAALIAWSHRHNIARLARGEEPRLSFGRSSGDPS